MEELDFSDTDVEARSNWSQDYLNELDTSLYPFPNTLWHVKPGKEMAIKTIVTLMIAVPGLFMNAIIVITLSRNRWLWSASNMLIANMAIVDFFTLLLCPWFFLVRDFYQNFILKNFGCRFEGFLQAAFLLANVASVLLVSYDRLAAACLPSEARITKSSAPKLIAASWGISVVFALPWIINREYVERQWMDYLETFCVEDPNVLIVYWHFILLVLVWVPLGTMCLTYGIIIYRLTMSARKLTSRGGGRLVARAKGRTLRMAGFILLADFVCRVPYSFLIYLRNMSGMEINWIDGSYSVLWFTAINLMYLNCTINPLIYGFTNSRILKAMDKTTGVAYCKFGSWCCVCASSSKTEMDLQHDKNTAKIFVIESTPRPDKKLARVFKNFLHINADCIDLSTAKLVETTNKPTKITPLSPIHHKVSECRNKFDIKIDDRNDEKDTKSEQITEQDKL